MKYIFWLSLMLWASFFSQADNRLIKQDAKAEITYVENTREAGFRTGSERMEVYLPLLEGKKVGVLTNQTGMVGEVHLVDTLLAVGVELVRIYSPEHGFRGQAEAGEKVDHQTDQRTGLPIVSLYGSNRKPKPEQLEDIDIMLFDLQDVGVRFYTYTSTLHYLLEACSDAGIPVMVLDRPNPNGRIVDGNIPDLKKPSFVCMHPVPILHGLTIGEYAQMLVGEAWLNTTGVPNLTVIACEQYLPHKPYELPVAPSPNLANQNAIYLYASLCLFEGTKMSIGRGTDHPFEVFGHPEFEGPFEFTPRSIPGFALNPKHQDKLCRGRSLRGEGERVYISSQLNMSYLMDSYQFFKNDSDFFIPFFDVLAGGTELRLQMEAGLSVEAIRDSWKLGLNEFESLSKSYYLYP